jgi:hypothetical protein
MIEHVYASRFRDPVLAVAVLPGRIGRDGLPRRSPPTGKLWMKRRARRVRRVFRRLRDVNLSKMRSWEGDERNEGTLDSADGGMNEDVGAGVEHGKKRRWKKLSAPSGTSGTGSKMEDSDFGHYYH